MSNKITTEFRVKALPVRAMFSRVNQPLFHITDFPYEKGGQNWSHYLWPSETGYGESDKGILPDTDVGTMEPDRYCSACYARPFIVPHNNKITGNYTWNTDYNDNLKEVWWEMLDSLNCWYDERGYDSRERHSAIHGECTDSGGAVGYLEIQTRDVIKWMGFWAMIEQAPKTSDATEMQSGGGGAWPYEDSLRGYTEFRFIVGSYNDSAMNPEDTADFVVRLDTTGYPQVFRCWDINFTQRELLQDLKPVSNLGAINIGEVQKRLDSFGAMESPAKPRAKPTMFEVRIVGGTLQIRLDSGEQPFVYNLTEYNTAGEEIAYIRYVNCVIDDFQIMNLAVHPMKFRAAPVQRSQWFTLGFNPLTSPATSLRDDPLEGGPFNGTPSGTGSLLMSDVSGTQVRYKVQLSNPVDGTYNGIEYSAVTRSYRSVVISYEEIYTKDYAAEVDLYPEQITISHQFNPDDLSVTANAALVFNNFQNISGIHPLAPNMSWGEWANTVGAIAIYIDVKINWGSTGTTGWYRRFTGYANLKNTTTLLGQGRSKYVMHCHSREVAMATQKFNIPWMDGWNHYYAAAYLASQGNAKIGTPIDTDVAFRAYVPNDPYSASPSLPIGELDWFLPMGTGGSPLMSFPAGANPWQMLGKIAKTHGFMRYFDVFGRLHYEKFQPEIPGSPYRWFQARDGDPISLSDPPTVAVFAGQVTRDLTQVRNDVTVIGVDAFGPMWNPIVAHRSDDLSKDFYSAQAFDPTVFNFLGFDQGLVWMDSIFANQQFASDAADGVYNWVRYPAVTANFSTWLQPDVFPGMWVGVNEWKTGLYNRASAYAIPLLVMGTVDTLVLGQIPVTQIAARFVPDVL